MTTVKMFNLAQDSIDIRPDLIKGFEEVLGSGEFILGKELSAFEKAFADYLGVKYAIGVGNGTDALRVGGLSLGLKRGDAFVTAPNSYVASAMALSPHGLVPRFCDIEPDTYNMDPGALRKLLKDDKSIKLCIPVHLYGQAARMDEITEICRQHNVRVMEDACQAHGALYKGKKAGTFGDVAAFSFYPTKNLGCYGDGGIIVTNSEQIYQKTLMLRNYGQSDKHVHDDEGFNTRLDELQAKLLRIKLPHLDRWNNARRTKARMYDQALANLPIGLPKRIPDAYHVYHLYVIRVRERDALRSYLNECGVPTLIHYPTPIHLQEAYRSLGFGEGSFPNVERAAKEIISLPLYPSISEEDVLYVSRCIRNFYSK